MMVSDPGLKKGVGFRSNRKPERKARYFDDNKSFIKPGINQENLTGLRDTPTD